MRLSRIGHARRVVPCHAVASAVSFRQAAQMLAAGALAAIVAGEVAHFVRRKAQWVLERACSR